jgi:hypothetical protein
MSACSMWIGVFHCTVTLPKSPVEYLLDEVEWQRLYCWLNWYGGGGGAGKFGSRNIDILHVGIILYIAKPRPALPKGSSDVSTLRMS